MIAEILKAGKENATSTETIMKLCGLSSKRAVLKQVQKERKAGALICSRHDNVGGYYLPDSREDVEQLYKSMRSRALNSLEAVTPARRYLKEHEGKDNE